MYNDSRYKGGKIHSKNNISTLCFIYVTEMNMLMKRCVEENFHHQ